VPPNIPYYSNITREQAIEITVGLHRETGALTAQFTTRNYRIEVAILVITVITSGGIWVLLGASFATLAAWFGAVFSTVVTGLTIYQLSLGPKQRVKPVYTLYEAIGKELARLRGVQDFNPTLFWDQYKSFEFELQKLQNPAIAST
jgi:hypothetical protein